MNKRRNKRVLRPWIKDFIIQRRPAQRRFSKAVVVCCDKGTTRNGWNIKEIEDGTVFIKAFFTKSAVSKALGETGTHEDWRTAMLLVRDVKLELEYYGPNKQSYEFVLVIDNFVIWDNLSGLRANNTIHWCMNYADVQQSAVEFIKEMEQKAIGPTDETGDHSDSLSISQLLQEIAEVSAEIETSTSCQPSVERNKSDEDWMKLLKKPLTVEEFLIPKETQSALDSLKEWDANYRPSASSSSSSSDNQSASAGGFNIEKISTLASTNKQPQVIPVTLKDHGGEKELSLGDDSTDSTAIGQAFEKGNRLSAGDCQSQSEVSVWQDCMDSVHLSDESLDIGSPDAQSTQIEKRKHLQMEEKGQIQDPKTAVLDKTNNEVVKNNVEKVCANGSDKEPSSDEVVEIETQNSNVIRKDSVESDSLFVEIASRSKSSELITANEQAELNRLGALTVNWSTSDPSSTNHFSQSTLYHKSILDEHVASGKPGNTVQPNPQKVNKGSEELFISSSAEEILGKSGEKDSNGSPCAINRTNHEDDENACNSSREIVSPSPENTAKKKRSFSFSIRSLLVGGSNDTTMDSSTNTTETSNSEVEADKDSSAVVTNSKEEEGGGDRGVLKIRSMINNLMQKFQHNSNVVHKTMGCSGIQKVQSSPSLQQTNMLHSSQGSDDSGSEHLRLNSEKNIMYKYYTEGSPIKSKKSNVGLSSCMSIKERKRKTIGCTVESSTSGQCNNSKTTDEQPENESNSEDRQTHITIDSSAEHVNTSALPQTDVRDTESLSLDTNYDFTPSDKQAESQSKEISIDKHNFVTSLKLIERQSQKSQVMDKISPTVNLNQGTFESKHSRLRLGIRKKPFHIKHTISSSENRTENNHSNDKQAINTSIQTSAESESEEEISSRLDSQLKDLVKPCFVVLNRLDEGKLLLSALCNQQSEETIGPGDDSGELTSDNIEQSSSESPSPVENSEIFDEGTACDNTNVVRKDSCAGQANLQAVDQYLLVPSNLNNKDAEQCKKRNENLQRVDREKRSPRIPQSSPTNKSISCKKLSEERGCRRKEDANNLSQNVIHKRKSVEVESEGPYFNTQPMTRIHFHESQGFQPMFSQEMAVSYLGINIEMEPAKPLIDKSGQSLAASSMTAGLLEDDNEDGNERCVSSDNMRTKWMTQARKIGLNTKLLDNWKTTVHSKETEKSLDAAGNNTKGAYLKDNENLISKINNNSGSIADENLETEELHTDSETSEKIIAPEKIATKESVSSGNCRNLSTTDVNDKQVDKNRYLPSSETVCNKDQQSMDFVEDGQNNDGTKSTKDVLIQDRFGRFKGTSKISQIQGTSKTSTSSISVGEMAKNHMLSKSPKELNHRLACKRKRSTDEKKRNTTVVSEGLQKSKRARIDADSPRKSTVASNAEIDYLLGKLPSNDASRDFVKTNSSVKKTPSNEDLLITMFPLFRLDRIEYQLKPVNKSRSKTKKDASDIFSLRLKGVKKRPVDHRIHDSSTNILREDVISLNSSEHSENERDLSDIDVLNKQGKRKSSTPKKSQIEGTLKISSILFGEIGKKHMSRTSQLNLNVDKMTGAIRFSRDQGLKGQMIDDQNNPEDKASLKRLERKRNKQHSEGMSESKCKSHVVTPDMVKRNQNNPNETTTANQGNVSSNLRKKKPSEIPLLQLTENGLKQLGRRALDKDTLVHKWLVNSESQTSDVCP